VRFLNTSNKFSSVVFEFTKTRDVPGVYKKTGTFRGHESESGDCPQETGTSGNPILVVIPTDIHIHIPIVILIVIFIAILILIVIPIVIETVRLTIEIRIV
jgi:hypothetical protein